MTIRTEVVKPLHWDATSQDYSNTDRDTPAIFVLLQYLGNGLDGQDIHDLGSGTGTLIGDASRVIPHRFQNDATSQFVVWLGKE
jgi:hypothetical protein